MADSRYGVRARVGWAVLAVVVLAGIYQLLGLIVDLPGTPGRAPVTGPSPRATVSPSAGPGAPSPAPGTVAPTPTNGGGRIIVVQPQRGDRGPAGEPGAVVIVKDSNDPSPRPSPTRASSPTPRPSPSPTCLVTVGGQCFPPGRLPHRRP